MQLELGRQIPSAHTTLSVYSLTTRHFAAPSSQSSLAILLSLMLLAGLAACGPASSDNAPNLKQRTNVDGLAAGGNSAPGTVPASGGNNVPQRDGLPSKLDGTTNVKTDETDRSSVPGIPDSIAKGLESPDARLRVQALTHWDTKGIKAPLDPVFEALEDEDDDVRAKATAIIEEQWAIEREREKG